MKPYASLGPRLSELVAKGLIEETGGSSLEHQRQMGGRMAGDMKNGFWTLMLLVVTIITWCTRDVTDNASSKYRQGCSKYRQRTLVRVCIASTIWLIQSVAQ